MARSFLVEGQSPSAYALTGVALTSGGATAISTDPAYAHATQRSPGRRVALVSGGGAGHEPMHAGFVGPGGLDAAVPGEVFTSPHNGQVYAAGRAVALPGGILHVVKNYTGDRINFSIAAERLRSEGHDVAEVVVEDDLGSEGHEVGRRGTGATVVVEKVLGAAADDGLALDALAEIGQRVADRSRTLSVASAAHHGVDDGSPAFTLDDGELEYGVGIHGERAAGSLTESDLGTLVSRMVGELLDALPEPDDGVVLVVNGLGGVSNLELLHVAAAAHGVLEARDVRVRSVTAQTLVSALDMRGFSVTLTAAEEAWLPHWFAPHATVGLPSPLPLETLQVTGSDDGAPAADGSSPWLHALTERFATLRRPLNELDQRSGDGDLGTNLANGTAAAARLGVADADVVADVRALADAFLDSVGGSSGPLFGLVFQQAAAAEGGEDPAARLADGLRDGLVAVQRIGGAELGDRTMVDALHPALHDGDEVRTRLDAAAVVAALAGARATSDLVARRGRASYVGERAVGHPDPGAVGLSAVLLALVERLDGDQPRLREELDALLG